MQRRELVHLRDPFELVLDHLSTDALKVILQILDPCLQVEMLSETCQDPPEPCDHVGKYVDTCDKRARLTLTPRPTHPPPR